MKWIVAVVGVDAGGDPEFGLPPAADWRVLPESVQDRDFDHSHPPWLLSGEAASVESKFAAEKCYNKYSRRNRCLILKSNGTLAEVNMANAPTMEMYIMDNVIGR